MGEDVGLSRCLPVISYAMAAEHATIQRIGLWGHCWGCLLSQILKILFTFKWSASLLWITGSLLSRYSEESNHAVDEEIKPLTTDLQISVSTSLLVLALYTATLHVSVPGGDSGNSHVISVVCLHSFTNSQHNNAL